MTAQVNQVRPGGKAQTAHRDYHLGFMSADEAMRYPAHAHEVTATLTLQGAVAHVDMGVESGPTKLLPFSQLYGPGYVAFHDAGFRDHFEAAHVQVPLEKGDAVFFNPALFHAGGENRSRDVERMVNLLAGLLGLRPVAGKRWTGAACPQALFPELVKLKQGGALGAAELDAAIAACAEGYPFPTNLDTDPPVGGLAPPSMADVMRRALNEGWTTARFAQALPTSRRDRRPDPSRGPGGDAPGPIPKKETPMPDLLCKPFGTHGEVHRITPERAGWRYVGFALHRCDRARRRPRPPASAR